MTHYVIVGAVLFALGLVGFLSRRNLIIIFLCTELMFQGAVVNLVAYSRLHENLEGQSFALFLLAIAAVEASLALALVVLLFRRKGTLDVDVWRMMQG